MKRLVSSWSLIFLGLSSSPVLAQPVYTLDPPQLINDYVSIGEWNGTTVEGWGPLNSLSSKVANGVLQLKTIGGDPWLAKVGINAPDDFTTVQVRLRVLKGERTGWEMFWATAAPGEGDLSGSRRIGYSLGFDDDQFHILDFDMSSVVTGGKLTVFRVDTGQNPGNEIEIDYVRVGKISPDTDSDGLPDTVETATGVFVSARDTGTKPNVADSDGDGVPDGIEVTYGTDPNDPSKFPIATIDRYTANPATYIVGVAITPNVPTVSNGSATSFQISPALPAGLVLNTTSGQISGTPTAAVPQTNYTVVANFAGGKTATNVLAITVRYPYFDFTVPKLAVKVNQNIAPITPNIYGPAPTGFTVSPSLPDGLAMDPTTGEVSGMPSTYTPLASYTLTATYASGPVSTNVLQLAVIETPSLSLDPQNRVVEWFSLGEGSDPAELGGFFRNNTTLSIADGLISGITTGGDPFFGRNFTVSDPYMVFEFKMRVNQPGTSYRLYWSESDPTRGMSETTSWPIPGVEADGQFHVYQVDFTKATLAPFTAIRMDFGDGPDTAFGLDYVRLGSLTYIPKLAIASQAGGKIRISWNAALTHKLQSTAALAPSGWVDDKSTVTTQGDQKYIEVTPTTTVFYRLAQ